MNYTEEKALDYVRETVKQWSKEKRIIFARQCGSECNGERLEKTMVRIFNEVKDEE